MDCATNSTLEYGVPPSIRIDYPTSNHCSRGTLLQFSLRGSHLNICYYHKDLHYGPLRPSLRPRLRCNIKKPHAFLLIGVSYLPQRRRIGPTLQRHPFSGLIHSPLRLNREGYVETRDPPPLAPAGGSCHPSPGGFPYIFRTSESASRRPEGGASSPSIAPGEGPGLVSSIPLPITALGVCWGHPSFRRSAAQEPPGAREMSQVGAPKTVTADWSCGVPGHP